METIKISEFEIQITKSAPIQEPIVNKYERTFIEEQIKKIQADKDNYCALRDAELLECQNILAEMDKLGIKTKVKPYKEEELKITSDGKIGIGV